MIVSGSGVLIAPHYNHVINTKKYKLYTMSLNIAVDIHILDQ